VGREAGQTQRSTVVDRDRLRNRREIDRRGVMDPNEVVRWITVSIGAELTGEVLVAVDRHRHRMPETRARTALRGRVLASPGNELIAMTPRRARLRMRR
jgi:hypothetical protein